MSGNRLSGTAVQNTHYWLGCAWAIFRKDIRIELRTRYALGAVMLFAVSTLVAVSASLNGTVVKSDVKAALLWIILLFAALSGLARVFVREEEAGTAPALRLNAPATAVYAGKLLFNIALTFAVELVSVPLFLLVMPPQTVNYGLLIGVLVLGGLGLAGASTFVAAMIAQASSGKTALFFIAAFPVVMPLLLVAVQATFGAFTNVPFYVNRAHNDLILLTGYTVIIITAAFLLFAIIWHD